MSNAKTPTELSTIHSATTTVWPTRKTGVPSSACQAFAPGGSSATSGHTAIDVAMPRAWSSDTACAKTCDAASKTGADERADLLLRAAARIRETKHDWNAVLVLERLKKELKPLVPAPGRGRGYGLVVWHLGAGKTAVQMRLNADGSVVVFTGVPDQGAGAFTVCQAVVGE